MTGKFLLFLSMMRFFATLYRVFSFGNYYVHATSPLAILASVPCYTNITLVAGLATGTLELAWKKGFGDAIGYWRSGLSKQAALSTALHIWLERDDQPGRRTLEPE